MTGVLLNSGDLQKYSPLGDEGQPVYSVATQLREVIRARVGSAAANCLAIPKVNESRSTVDWYASQSGAVVPWSAATPEERATALASLDRTKQAVMTSLSAISGVSGREQQIIQSLKDKVFTHPDNSCVFLVNGEPVLTFWGFHIGEAPLADPFYNLRPPTGVINAVPPVVSAAGLGAGAPTAVAAAVTTVQRRPWWHWLLLALLLLALLFLLLRACAPSGSINLPGFPAVGFNPKIDLPNVPATDVNPNLDLTVGERELRQGRIDLTGRAAGEVNVALPDLSGSLGVVPLGVTPLGSVTGADNAAVEPGTAPIVDHTLMPPLPPAVDAQAEPPADAAVVDKALVDQTTPEQNTPPDATVPVPDVPDVAAGAVPGGTTPPLGQAMQIPSDAVQSGSVSFLDGRWRAAGGIQDANTGQPVRLLYDFKDGKGAVTVEKSGGVRCQTNATSQMAGGQLVISGAGGAAQCSDGTTMALPTISCTPSQSGQANCTGVSSDGKPLPIMIRQSP
jgi:hypothetical protein